MYILIWVIVIAALIGLGMKLRRNWSARQALNAAAAEPAADSSAAQAGLTARWTSAIQERWQEVQSGLGRKPQGDTVTQFRAWAADAFAANAEIQQWLAALQDEQIAALTDHLAAFCRDMGFELGWLLDGQLAQNKELKQGLTQIILFYSRASYEAVKLQDEVQVFHIYHAYMQNPQSRANRELGEHLFGKLVEQGLSKVSITEHLAAPADRRQQQIVDTIQQCAQNDPKKLHILLKSVLLERALPPVVAEAPTMNTNGAVKA